MNVEEKQLRKELGMSDSQLLESADGALGDILSVKGNRVTIGCLATRQVVVVDRTQILKSRKKG